MKAGIEQGVGNVTLTVTEAMTANLGDHVHHRVYGTFWACYHAELAARRAIEPFFDDDENAVGSALALTHHAMAPVGATFSVTAAVTNVQGRRIECSIKITHDDRLIATGMQEQVVLPSTVINQKIQSLYSDH